MAFPTTHDAIAMLERGRAAEAISLLERLARRTPLHVTAHVLLARAYEAEGRCAEANRQWQQAHLLMPNSPVIAAGRRRTQRAAAPAENSPDSPPDDPPASPPETPPAGARATEARVAEARPAEEPERPRRASPPARPEGPRAGGPGAPAIDFNDLDSLIEELEGTRRITLDPEAADLPAPRLDDDLDDMVSETLARIYAGQGQHAEAARVYRRLAEQHPRRTDEFREKARTQQQRAEAPDA